MSEELADLVRAELEEPVDERVTMAAAQIAALYPAAARAVLFYGSCLRQAELEGQVLDFYLIVSDYEDAYGKSWLVAANRLIPPNVFLFQGNGMVAKYAVLSEADFWRLNGPETLSVSVWARFAQPSRIVWQADEAAAASCVKSIARAAPTLLGATLPLFPGEAAGDDLQIWREAFALTYDAELRAERKDRAASVVDSSPVRYRLFLAPALRAASIQSATPADAARLLWAKRRRAGKLLSILRLAKASGTFSGGIDYLAWKINRHSGAGIEIAPWHRRWPLVAALILLPRLLRRRAIR
jgi:hypothetical protein